MRAERDLTAFGFREEKTNIEFWSDLNWVAGFFPGDETPVSFDLEDNAMAAVSYVEGRPEPFFYHEHEALWTKLFMEYAGGEAKTEELLLERFMLGTIRLP
jgi:hypothetical protein